MRMRRLWRLGLALVVLAALVSAATGTTLARGRAGHVFTMTNSAGGNEILVFERMSDGTLTPAGAVATGGLGSGAGLGSQGALVLDGHWLLAVNAGSNSVSVFRERGGELELRDVEPSGGIMPISVTSAGRIVYVLNAGGDGNITGFRLDRHGDLTPIPGAVKPLSSGASGPAQIEFSPRGNHLIVTEKATNLLLAYPVDRHGMAGDPVITPSTGQTPFGFAFHRNRLVVSEAFGGAPLASAMSSHILEGNGALSVVSAAVATNQTAACWVVITNNGKFAYTTNTGSNSISAYELGRDGSLTLIGNGIAGMTGAGPIDMALSGNSRYVYTTNTGDGSLSVFAVNNHDGSLTPIVGITGLPAGIVGLAAR